MGEPTPSTEHVHSWSPAYWSSGFYANHVPLGPGMYVTCLDRDCNQTRQAMSGPAFSGMITK